MYAYSRDGALPGSRWLKRLNPHTQTPVNAVVCIIVISALLALLLFAGPVTVNAVFTASGIAAYVAFTFPIALKLFVTGAEFQRGVYDGQSTSMMRKKDTRTDNLQDHGISAASLVSLMPSLLHGLL